MNRIEAFLEIFGIASERDTNCYTAMSWALSLGSRDAMNVSFNATDANLDLFFGGRNYTAARLQQEKQDLAIVIKAADTAPGGNNATLKTILDKLQSSNVAIQGAQAPAAAAKRN